MKIISHRGGAKLAPENSVEAIKVSRSLGVDAIEIDVRSTKDNKLVVFHDPSLKRLAGSSKRINKLTLSEIRKIKLKNGTYIPTLEEIILAAGDLTLCIEGKDEGWAEILSTTLKKYRGRGNFKVLSFNEEELRKFNQLSKNIGCYFTNWFRGYRAISVASQNGYEGINIQFMAFNPTIYWLAKRRHLKINLFTLNSRLISGVIGRLFSDIGIITNRPDKLLKLTKKIRI